MSEELLKTLVMEAEKKIEEETEKAQEESWKDNVFNKNKWQNGLVDNRPQGFFVCKKLKYKKALENVKMGKAPSIQLKGHNKGH